MIGVGLPAEKQDWRLTGDLDWPFDAVMKTAYELAMERLAKDAPSHKLTEAQKKELSDIDSVYDAKIAEREIFVKGQLEKARREGDYDAISQLERQLTSDRKSLEADREIKKEKVRETRA